MKMSEMNLSKSLRENWFRIYFQKCFEKVSREIFLLIKIHQQISIIDPLNFLAYSNMIKNVISSKNHLKYAKIASRKIPLTNLPQKWVWST